MDQDTNRVALKDAIYKRRSTRAYTTQQVPSDILEEIIDAGRHAPTGNNLQTTHFYVITNADKLSELRSTVTKALASMEITENMVPYFVSLINRAKEQEVDVIYGAPALIVTASKKGSSNSVADCSCALQNMMLTASACGLGNCWINQFFNLRDVPPIKAFFTGLGVLEDEEICGSLALGYTEKLVDTPLPRTGYPVTYIL